MAIRFPDPLDDSTLRAIERAAKDAKRLSLEIEAAFGPNLTHVSGLGESLANLSALCGTPRLADLQSQFTELAALGRPPDLSIDALAGIPLASQILDSHAKLSEDLASLATMRTAIAGASEFHSSMSAALETHASLADLGLSTSIQEALKGFETSGLLGTQRILEECGALGLARGLEDQINALASLVDSGIGTSFPSFDVNLFKDPVYPGVDNEDDDVEELRSPPSICRVIDCCDESLTIEGFEGASDEFDRAIYRYENGELKEAMAEALKALESTLKTICDRRGWSYARNATAKTLLNIVFVNNLVETSLLSHFNSLRALLESGLPTVTNPVRHGQGSYVVVTPDYLAAYALHLCASNIVFLVECYRALPKRRS